MRIYWIDVPTVSSGLRRTYHKKLEVYSGVQEGSGGCTRSDTLYRILRGEWVDKKHSTSEFSMPFDYSTRKYNNEIHKSMPQLSLMRRGCAYATLEMAQAAKMILIEDMKRKYEAELDNLRDMLKKNVPNIEKPLAVLKADYPEYFI